MIDRQLKQPIIQLKNCEIITIIITLIMSSQTDGTHIFIIHSFDVYFADNKLVFYSSISSVSFISRAWIEIVTSSLYFIILLLLFYFVE